MFIFVILRNSYIKQFRWDESKSFYFRFEIARLSYLVRFSFRYEYIKLRFIFIKEKCSPERRDVVWEAANQKLMICRSTKTQSFICPTMNFKFLVKSRLPPRWKEQVGRKRRDETRSWEKKKKCNINVNKSCNILLIIYFW